MKLRSGFVYGEPEYEIIKCCDGKVRCIGCEYGDYFCDNCGIQSHDVDYYDEGNLCPSCLKKADEDEEGTCETCEQPATHAVSYGSFCCMLCDIHYESEKIQ